MRRSILNSSSMAALFAGAGTILFAPPALAQSQDAGGGIETVTVTAQHVVQDEQKTPIAMSVMTASDLQNLGGPANVTALQQMAPNVQVNDNGNGGAQFTVRGIASTNTAQWGDPAIAFNVDGVYEGRWNQAGGAFFDVQRVELLLGPQGTLYGRNATAGAINVITNKPTGDFHIAGSVEAGAYGEVTLEGMMNIPVTDNFWVRAAYQSTGHGSFFNDAPPNAIPDTVAGVDVLGGTNGQPITVNYPGQSCAGYNNITHSICSQDNQIMDNGMANQQNARIHFQWNVNSDITSLFTIQYSSIRGTPPATGKLVTASGYVGSPYYIPYDGLTGAQDTWEYQAAWNTDWSTGIGTLHYTAAYDFQHDQYDQGASIKPGIANQYSWYWQIPQQTTSELRLSNALDNLTYVVGLYWYQENISKDLRTGYGAAFVHSHLWDDSKAAYGQLTYSILPGLRLTGGLRITEDSKGTEGGGYYYNNGAPNTLCNATNFVFCLVSGTAAERTPNTANLKWKKLNYKVGIDYDLTDQSLLYATYGTGYKAGGILDGEESQVGHFNPENVTAAEIGSKNRFFHNTVQLNADVFHYLYTDFQVSYNDLVNHIIWTVNAQSATPEGAELHAIWAPNDSDYFELSLSYLDAYYEKFVLPAVDTYGRQDYSGTEMANSPPWDTDFIYEHTFDLKNVGTLVARFNTHFQATEQLDYRTYASTKQKGYTNSGFSLTYQGDSRWDVQLWARNLENEATMQSASPVGPGSPYASANINAPRTYGIRLEAKY